jgi:hypothetical protein
MASNEVVRVLSGRRPLSPVNFVNRAPRAEQTAAQPFVT